MRPFYDSTVLGTINPDSLHSGALARVASLPSPSSDPFGDTYIIFSPGKSHSPMSSSASIGSDVKSMVAPSSAVAALRRYFICLISITYMLQIPFSAKESTASGLHGQSYALPAVRQSINHSLHSGICRSRKASRGQNTADRHPKSDADIKITNYLLEPRIRLSTHDLSRISTTDIIHS